MNPLPNISYSGDELVSFFKNKDKAVFNYLYKNYAAVLYGAINKIVGDDDRSEDVMQEVFVKIWEKIDQYNPQKGLVCTWMINIARNIAIDVLRSKGDIMKHKIQTDESMLEIPVNPYYTDSSGIKSLVAKLRPECTVILDMLYYKGYGICDIANALSISEGTVKTRLRQAIKILRKNFQDIALAR